MLQSDVSHYRLLDRLGEGGMGVVYRARDLRLGREVAIKLLRTDPSIPPEWLARFEREARLASSLQHPHICTIHELGEHEGQPFIAMERLEGRTVKQMIEAGPVPIPRLLHLAAQIADALDAAHRRGIVHRDIKPANLFVTYGDHLKVLDFGLAKATSGNSLADTLPASGSSPTLAPAPVVTSSSPTLAVPVASDLTGDGVAVGTAAYMSPEQAHAQPLDARSDLFSLGSVLYEMATGRRAFGGDDPAQIAARIVNGILLAPRLIDSGIPESVQSIILKLMATDSKGRYQSAAELLADIQAARRQLDPGAVGTPGGGGAIPPPVRRTTRWVAAASVGALALAGIAAYAWFGSTTPALTDRDTILIGAFDNTTGEPLFDETLVTALRVQLGQSPFLDIITDQRIRETLRSMGRREDERLTAGVAREVCQRLGLKAMLDGSIATLGSSYVLRLEATDCATGDALAREQAEAGSRDRVLKELGSLSSRMRTRLGESLPSLQRFDVPIEQATTPSLTALKAYALGLEERRRGREVESIAFFNQAIDLDSGFASAYATLSTVYGGLGEGHRSEDYARQAFEHEARVSERERLFITYQYHERVTGDEGQAATTLELWKAAYPRDSRPPNALAVIHNRMGRYERAVDEAKDALRRSPGHPFPMSNMAIAFMALGRYEDARRVGDEAVALGVETTPTRRTLFHLGVLAGDGSAAGHLTWAKDRPREFDLVSAQAQVAAYAGRLKEAGELYRRAIDMALARNLRGTASGYAAVLAWTEVLYRDGRAVAQTVRDALALVPPTPAGSGTLPRFREAAALAMAGLAPDALEIVTAAETRYPEATFVRSVLGPVVRAVIALKRQRPQEALERLEIAAPTELGTVAALVPVFLRAEAYRQQGMIDAAVREYRRVLEHRGVDAFAQILPLSHLALARLYAGAGDVAAARRAYDDVFAIWKDADPDLAPLVAARAEAAQLTASPAQ